MKTFICSSKFEFNNGINLFILIVNNKTYGNTKIFIFSSKFEFKNGTNLFITINNNNKTYGKTSITELFELSCLTFIVGEGSIGYTKIHKVEYVLLVYGFLPYLHNRQKPKKCMNCGSTTVQ